MKQLDVYVSGAETSTRRAMEAKRLFCAGLTGARLGSRPRYENRPLEGQMFEVPCLEPALNLLGKNKPENTEKVHKSSKSKVKDQRFLSRNRDEGRVGFSQTSFEAVNLKNAVVPQTMPRGKMSFMKRETLFTKAPIFIYKKQTLPVFLVIHRVFWDSAF